MSKISILRILRRAAFLVLAGACVCIAFDIFHYKSRYVKVMRTFLSEPRDSYDVIALGSSHMYCTLNPIEMFREYGIRSYVLATRRQPLAVSYWYARMALERQRPKVVILETFMLVNPENYFRIDDGVAHDSLDPVPFGAAKMKMIGSFEHQGAPEDYVMPFIKYHTRWKELTRQDFLIGNWKERDFCKGFKVFCQAKPVKAKPLNYRTVEFSPVREEYFDWVDRLDALASAHGARLLLLTAPYDVSGFKDSLTQIKMTKSLHAYAKSKGIPFLDMNEHIDTLGFDNERDFFDFGHLNAYGAKKATKRIGWHLKSHFAVERASISEDERKSWEADAADYDKLYKFASRSAKK